MWAVRGQRVDRAFEAVEGVMLAIDHHVERFVIFVFANFACSPYIIVSHADGLSAVLLSAVPGDVAEKPLACQLGDLFERPRFFE